MVKGIRIPVGPRKVFRAGINPSITLPVELMWLVGKRVFVEVVVLDEQ